MSSLRASHAHTVNEQFSGLLVKTALTFAATGQSAKVAFCPVPIWLVRNGFETWPDGSRSSQMDQACVGLPVCMPDDWGKTGRSLVCKGRRRMRQRAVGCNRKPPDFWSDCHDLMEWPCRRCFEDGVKKPGHLGCSGFGFQSAIGPIRPRVQGRTGGPPRRRISTRSEFRFP